MLQTTNILWTFQLNITLHLLYIIKYNFNTLVHEEQIKMIGLLELGVIIALTPNSEQIQTQILEKTQDRSVLQTSHLPCHDTNLHIQHIGSSHLQPEMQNQRVNTDWLYLYALHVGFNLILISRFRLDLY